MLGIMYPLRMFTCSHLTRIVCVNSDILLENIAWNIRGNIVLIIFEYFSASLSF